MNKIKIGLQTFTIRKDQKKNMEEAYLPILGLGICDLEIARIPFTRENAHRIKALSEKHGINPVAIQVKPKHVFGHADEIIDFCKAVGCKNVVISMLPFRCILGKEERFYSFIETLDRQFEVYEKHGITLAYHHHNWEYIRLSSGKTRMAELLSRTQKIKFVHDTYWTARCGIDPAFQIREFGNRLLGIHLRDLTFEKKLLGVVPRDTFIGGGIIDFERALVAAKEVGCEYAVIEQNSSVPYVDVKQSYENLLKLKSEIKEISL